MKDGILARATLLPRTEKGDPLVHNPHHSTRWVHVHMAMGDGTTVLHLQGVYGVVDSPEANSRLMDQVLEHSARLGNAPQVVGGDFNAPLGDLLRAPRSLVLALISRQLFDLDQEQATGAGHGGGL